MLLDYGLEGYGLYWYCIELITGKVDATNLNFHLEHDSRIIAKNTGSTTQRVEEMMRYFVKIGLFESSEGIITCLKIAKRLDSSMTSNIGMRKMITSIKQGSSGCVMTVADCVRPEEKRREENRIDNKDILSGKPDIVSQDVSSVIDYLNRITGSSYKASTRSHAQHISGRLSDGHSVDDLKRVIDEKAAEWLHDKNMCLYLRPQTLFSASKFQGYLRQANTEKTRQHDARFVSKPSSDIPEGFR